ncbi:MAG: DUF362 domain-containing protein [Armatimonadetes bacterium]|nr:DUF362 domain-containing protein [Armatimonadota bacterium]
MVQQSVDRRGFMAGVAAASVAASLAGRADAADEAVVVAVHCPGVAALAVDQRAAKVAKMVAAGLAKLTGKDGADAWKSLFRADDTVALKVNCLASAISTRTDVADAVARGVMSAGVPGDKCLVWERSERELSGAGYLVGANPAGYRVVATNSAGYGHDAEPTIQGTVTQKLSTLTTSHATALVSLPILKDHNLAGITAALKNHFGSINEPWKLHGPGICQAIADLNSIPALRTKHRLVVCDATTVVIDGGPSNKPDARRDLDLILLALDPVAHDTVGTQLIEDLRKEAGLRPLARVGRPPAYIKLAADLGLGIADPAKIRIERVEVA